MANFRDKVRNGADFAELLAIVRPGASSRELVKFFADRADYRSIARWKAGKEWPADWAVALLRSAALAQAAQIETGIARLRSGPGRKGNRANLKPFRQAA